MPPDWFSSAKAPLGHSVQTIRTITHNPGTSNGPPGHEADGSTGVRNQLSSARVEPRGRA
jgi:hypothetical protein